MVILHVRVVCSCLWDTCFLLFLLAPWFWAEPALALSCRSDQFQALTMQGYKCCKICLSEKENDKPCPGVQDQDCKCTAGYQCHTKSCDYCLRLPTCTKGQTIKRKGEHQYKYECTNCEHGTYLVSETGLCMNWTNCTSEGLTTITPGNRTHDVQCGSKGLSFSSISGSMHAVSLALLVAVAVFILILITVFLHLYIWRMRRKKNNTTEEQQPFPLTSCPCPLEDTHSCQFPEEERGGEITEEKTHQSLP